MIIAGLGRFGQVVNRILLVERHKTVVLDHQAEHVDEMRRFGVRGLLRRRDAAGSAASPPGSPRRRCWWSRSTTRSGRSSSSSSPGATRPDLHIVVRAFDRVAVYALFQAGANDIIREVFDSSVRAGRCALEGLGLHPFRAQKLVEAHVKFDRESMRMLAEVWDPEISIFENTDYIRLAAQRNAELERMMSASSPSAPSGPSGPGCPPPTPESVGRRRRGRTAVVEARSREEASPRNVGAGESEPRAGSRRGADRLARAPLEAAALARAKAMLVSI